MTLFIILVIFETEERLYKPHKNFFNISGFILATIITIEYFLSLWSVTGNEDFSRGSLTWQRLRWARKFYPLMDLVVIVSFWTVELLDAHGPTQSSSAKVIGSLRTLRLLRLFQIFEVSEGRRVKRAFSVLFRVMKNKGDDIFAALWLMFVALIFVSTSMYIVEGGNAGQSLDSFSSIPVSMYWGVITLTTIGYGDITPNTTAGQVLCCFVAFFSVCIGSIPIGIIGAGYVEALEERRREDALMSNRKLHSRSPDADDDGGDDENDEESKIVPTAELRASGGRNSLSSRSSSDKLNEQRDDSVS